MPIANRVYSEAVAFCGIWGVLTTMSDATENELVRQYSTGVSGSLSWIGGGIEGYTNYLSNNGSCVAMILTAGANQGKWIGAPCSNSYLLSC